MKRVLCLFIILCIIFQLPILALDLYIENENGDMIKINDFLDTKGHWAHDTILKVADYKLINGFNGNFMPDQPIKRGDLAIIIDRMLGLKTYSYNYYNDLSNNDYYTDALLKCAASGYITGVGSNEIDPDGYATREQVAVIISRIFDLENNYSGNTNFKDDSKISSWAKNSVSAMSKLGYINGDDRGYMNPQSYITRAEFVTLLNNFANTYIPRLLGTQLISAEYKNDFPVNVVVAKQVTFTNSSIGRDLILTQNTTGITLKNTVVRGRLLAMSSQDILLYNSTISDIVLLDGKSSISGISNGVECVTVRFNASESSLDAIPNKVILESGARVKIAGTMYENESVRDKVYYASELQGIVSDEQGYIVGGPRISSVSFKQGIDNTITVSNVRVTEGNNNIKEIGVIWLEQDEDENAVNPTYKKNDGKTVYRSDKIDELISFEVGEVEGTCAYRVYVRDKEGLLAYSKSTIFNEYDFTIDLNIYDNEYPKNVDVEMILKGERVPDISSIRVVYAVDELYDENHKEISLRLYRDPDAEYQPDTKKYKRYIGTITSPIERVNDEIVYTPPTAFGYIITYVDGTLINRFPILTNAVPEGVSPMANLETGSAVYMGSNNLTIKNNLITTRYALPQEVGIVYKTSNSDFVRNPTIDSSGWGRKASNVNIGINESESFNVSIPLINTDKYTHYAVYVKTSNGYWYGDVKTFLNDVLGDEGGYSILGIETESLGDSSVLFKLNMDYDKGMPTLLDKIEISEFGIFSLSDLNAKIYGNNLYFVLENLMNNRNYNLSISIENIAELKSNTINAEFNISSFENISLTNKNVNGNDVYYTISTKNNSDKFVFINVSSQYNNLNPSLRDTSLSVLNDIDLVNKTVVLEYIYYPEGPNQSNIYWVFKKTISLY